MKKRFSLVLLAGVLVMSTTFSSLAAVEEELESRSHFLTASISAEAETGLEGSGDDTGEDKAEDTDWLPAEKEEERELPELPEETGGAAENDASDETEEQPEGNESFEDEKPSEGEEKPSEGEEKPSEGEEKPSEGEEKPSEGEEKPSEGEAKPSEGEEKPSEGEERPSEGEEKPSEGEKQPEEEEPSEGEKQPEENESSENRNESAESQSSGEVSEAPDAEGVQPSGDAGLDSSINSGAAAAESQKAAAVGFQDFDMYGTDPHMTLTFDPWDKEVPELPETVTLLMEDETTREIQAKWITEDDFLNTDLEEYIYTLELPKGIRFAGEIEEDMESGQASLPWIEVVPEAGMMTYASGGLDISSLSFPIYDVRTPSKKMTFDGGDGKNAVLLFGGIGSCGKTNNVIRALQKLSQYVEMDNLSLYVFDIKNNSDDMIVQKLSSMGISQVVCANSVNNSNDYKSLYSRCCRSFGITSFTMPLVLYKNADGDIYAYSTDEVDIEDILEALEEGGIENTYYSDVQTLTISGQSLYSEAFDVLSLVNQQRARNGLSSLTMDKRLMEAAMTRAAECAVYYSHTRPTGKSCFSIIETMHAENIAYGYTTAEAVMDGWMNSPGHRANILGSCHQSIGIGCFRVNNRLYWVQVFGDAVEAKASKPSDKKQSYDIQTTSDYVNVGFRAAEKELYVNETYQLQVYAGSYSTEVEAGTYRWSSSAPTVAKVDSTGKVTAVSEGTAVVIATNKFNTEQTLEFTVTVKDLPGPDVNKITNTVSGVHVYWYPQAGAAKYYVYRASSKNGVYTKIKETTATNYTDTAVTSGTTYFYKISSIKGTRETAMSEAIGIAYVGTPDLTLRVNRSTGIGLGWNKITGATGYAIYRKTTGAWVRVATISGNSTLTWTDTAVKSGNGTVYHYTIRALAGSNMKTLSGCRNTGRTMVRLFTPTLSSAVKASSTSLKAAWNRNAAATGYEVRLMVGTTVYKTYTYGNNTTIAKTITGLPKGKTYKVQVRSYKKVAGVGSFYSAWSAAKNVTVK